MRRVFAGSGAACLSVSIVNSLNRRQRASARVTLGNGSAVYLCKPHALAKMAAGLATAAAAAAAAAAT